MTKSKEYIKRIMETNDLTEEQIEWQEENQD